MRTDLRAGPFIPSRRLGSAGLTSRMRGVTLLELLTVMVIVGILASLAVGSYRKYMLRSNRTDATTQLLRIQVAEEKYFLQNSSYGSDLSSHSGGLGMLGSTTTVTNMPSPNGYYLITVAPRAAGIATTFQVTASALGPQVQDADCVSLWIDDQGTKGSSPGATTTCWH